MLVIFILALINIRIFLEADLNRQLPDPPPIVNESFHKDGHNESWIMKVESDGSVWVQTVDDKTNIHFRPSPWHLNLFFNHISQLAAVTFKCDKEPDKECDLSKPYVLYIKNVQVELIEIKKKAAKAP